ncbi:hypothetical protein [Pseudomonas capsici]|uniref:hypothetical protein n=1 Tax=Pseudomonas capsici TaxID=2810614 RepID=UPI0021F22264|nr:hypothetical protein [Pseudomonas capsici]MCV4285894.1 hypothetical protein [Pseudomonas capsici]
MSLLSDLLANLPPPTVGTAKPKAANRSGSRPRPMLVVERPQPAKSSRQQFCSNAACASPEWRHARDQYINHIMTCRHCSAPTGRHCPAGADLRAIYDNTPMEHAQ